MSDQEKENQAEGTEQPDAEIQEQPTEKHEALPEVVTAIKAQYEKHIADLNSQHAKDIAERDAVITQLLATDKPEPTETIADRINKRRTFKKW